MAMTCVPAAGLPADPICITRETVSYLLPPGEMNHKVFISWRKRAALCALTCPPRQPLRICRHRRAAEPGKAFLQIDESRAHRAPGISIVENMESPQPRGVAPVIGGWMGLRSIHFEIFHRLPAPSPLSERRTGLSAALLFVRSRSHGSCRTTRSEEHRRRRGRHICVGLHPI